MHRPRHGPVADALLYECHGLRRQQEAQRFRRAAAALTIDNDDRDSPAWAFGDLSRIATLTRRKFADFGDADVDRNSHSPRPFNRNLKHSLSTRCSCLFGH